ncbi:hypothetical protein [Roseibium sp.]|uniref:hypothetical protein n=1 Tax=Roseibium sp. TaxID=1936156 RepID=UPI003BA87E69
MVTSRDLKAEISQLASEAEPKTAKSTRARKRKTIEKQTAQEAAPQEDVTTEETPDFPEDLNVLAEKLSEFADDAEQEIKDHPVTMVLGAFALGIIVGAVLRR